MAQPPILSSLALAVSDPEAFAVVSEAARKAFHVAAHQVGQDEAIAGRAPRELAELRYGLAYGALLAAAGLWNVAISLEAPLGRTREAFAEAATQAFGDMAARAANAGLIRPAGDAG